MTVQEVQSRIESSQGLVRSIALTIYRKMGGAHDLDDLIAYGQLGSAQAAREFDPTRNAQFSTYAYYRIRGAIYDGIGKMGWKRFTEQRDAGWNQVLAENQENSSSESTVDGGDWLQGVAEQMATVSVLASAVNSQTIDVADDSAEQPVMALCKDEMKDQLQHLIRELPTEIAQLISEMYYSGKTMQDVANRMGISKSWASSLHAKGLKTLADRLRKLGLDE